MIYYWILLLITLFLCTRGGTIHDRKRMLMVSVLLFFVFFAFRIGFTPDYENYEFSYGRYHMGKIDTDLKTEIGYQWLCKLLPTYRVLLVVFTGLFCFCYYEALSRYVSYRYWPIAIAILFLYQPFVLGNMSGIRSGFVTSLFFIAMMVKGKYEKIGLIVSMAIVLLATTFHRSAFALIPLMLIPKKPFGKRGKYIVYVLASIAVFVSIFYANTLNQYALGWTEDTFEGRGYETYFEENIETQFSFFTIIQKLILLTLLFLTIDGTQKEDSPIKCMFIKFTVFFYILVLAPSNIGLISRYYYYFAFPCMLGTTFVIEKATKDRKIIYLTCAGLYAYWQLFYMFRNEYSLSFMSYDNILFL